MKKLYTALIGIGIMVEVILIVFFGKENAAYGPVIFWAIALMAMINYILNNRTLSRSIKITKPELHKKHCIGRMQMRSALEDKAFLSALDKRELQLVEANKSIMKFLLICIGLFALSGFIVSLM